MGQIHISWRKNKNHYQIYKKINFNFFKAE